MGIASDRGRGFGSKRGFTLIEVLLASVILTLGTLLLHQSYLRLTDLYGRYVNGMRLEGWVGDQLWASREAIVYGAGSQEGPDSGSIEIESKTFNWTRKIKALSARGFYSIHLAVTWAEGNKPVQLSREVYVFRKELL